MKSEKKRLIKLVMHAIINAYEKTTLTSTEEEGFSVFYNEMKNLYITLFEGATKDNPYPNYEKEGGEKRFCNYNLFLELREEGIEFKVDKSIYDYRLLQILLRGLKQELSNGNYKPIHMIQTSKIMQTNFEGHTTVECEYKVYCTNSSYQCKQDGSKVHDFAKAYELLSDNRIQYGRGDPENGVAIYYFWDYPWESLFYFCASAIVAYNMEMKSFYGINICQNCGKMHMPKRLGAKRGMYCDKECQKRFYNKYYKYQNTCNSKQRQYLNVRLDRLKYTPLKNKEVIDLVPSIEKCKNCLKIHEKVRGGACPALASSDVVRDLNAKYFSEREQSKKKKNRLKVA